ncbi:unnamed protein product [Hymenolepis diminuta]|uniref:GRIP domain-containing protein n=1 Tax=Hymenolepis diminuta TaxID=6216 RepID=A0A158QFS6_HYMDI|nr:unnamed protein product [Hymenolepis diminuta]
MLFPLFNQELEQRDRVYDDKVMQLSSQLAEVIGSIERHAKALRESTTTTNVSLDAEGDSDLLDSLRHELESYQVQSQQHACTICVLEERLSEVAIEAGEAQTEVIRQRAENQLNAKDRFSKEVQVGTDKKTITNFSFNSRDKDCDLIEFRDEVNALNALRDDLNKEIQKIRAQNVIAEAKVSDIISAAAEQLKKKTETTLEINEKLHSQLTNANKQIDELTITIKKLKSQLSDKEKALTRVKASAQSTRRTLEKEEEKVTHLEALEASRRYGNMYGHGHSRSLLRKVSSTASDCQSAEYKKTIAAQRAVLAEMRQHLHYLSSNRLNELSPDELISLEEAHRRQVLGLRRQIRELQIQLETSRSGSSQWIKKNSNSVGNGIEGDVSSDLSSANDLVKIFKNLEENYFLLIHIFCQFFAPSSALLICRSCMDPANSELHERIWMEQHTFAISVKSKLNMVFNQLKRNASTIQSYEEQMAKLRKEIQILRSHVNDAND